MLARDYTKQIEVLEYTETPDGFGGNTVSAVSLGYSWARLENKSSSISQRVTALGLSELLEPLIFKVRYRKDLTYNGRTLALRYNGSDYAINSIVEADMMHRELEIICTKLPDSIVTAQQAFTYTLPFTLS